MSTIFIAVQCFQCSTMQVKQQRRSGNKWICAVCNEKQSVQKVFTRAPMAKDVRKFVQSFNMSRKSVDEQTRVHELHGGIIDDDQLGCARKKKRSDWSEYIELEDDRRQNGRGNEQEISYQFQSDFVEGRIVTELPEEKTTKFKSMKYPSRSEDGEGGEISKPIFTKRKHIAKHSSSQDENGNLELATAIPSSRWIKSVSQDDENGRMKTSIMAKATGSSKWSEYITEENRQTRNEENMATKQSEHILKTITSDEKVEDDIHPHFK